MTHWALGARISAPGHEVVASHSHFKLTGLLAKSHCQFSYLSHPKTLTLSCFTFRALVSRDDAVLNLVEEQANDWRRP